MTRPTDKSKMYSLLWRRALGNTIQNWPTVADYLRSDFRGQVGIREVGRPGGRCQYYVDRADVPAVVAEWIVGGIDGRNITISQMAPDEFITMQGELMETTGHLHLKYSHSKRPMRLIPADEWMTADWTAAVGLLEKHLWPGSLDDIYELLELYPGSIIEFSAYSREVGWAQARNTLIWEVRYY